MPLKCSWLYETGERVGGWTKPACEASGLQSLIAHGPEPYTVPA